MTENKSTTDGTASADIQPISLQPFAVQLQNIVPVDIVARRFPVEVNTNNGTPINISLNIVGLHIDADNLQAQVVIEVKLEPSQEPHSFELFLRMVGLFSYASDYKPDAVHQYLQQGSLSVMLPFVRELVLSLSTRLQIPPIMLSLIQLTTPPDTKDNADETSR